MDRGGQLLGRGETAAAGAVGADEIGVAEVADGRGPVFFAPRPQVAAAEAAEDRRAAGVGTFALQGVEDLLDGVAHALIIPSSDSTIGGTSVAVPFHFALSRRYAL